MSEEKGRFFNFFSFSGLSRCCSGPPEKGRERQKSSEEGQFWPISRRGGQTPLKPPCVKPPLTAAQEGAALSLSRRHASAFYTPARNRCESTCNNIISCNWNEIFHPSLPSFLPSFLHPFPPPLPSLLASFLPSLLPSFLPSFLPFFKP